MRCDVFRELIRRAAVWKVMIEAISRGKETRQAVHLLNYFERDETHHDWSWLPLVSAEVMHASQGALLLREKYRQSESLSWPGSRNRKGNLFDPLLSSRLSQVSTSSLSDRRRTIFPISPNDPILRASFRSAITR